ncbi:hypothetical protein AGDE_14314 [Angomonas deanei]|nr:hypothetical protein AGDE_14314 [Angomonas deanei]|eukprot:EPY21052.1 hypothetical protein AGDE_14314 [Angomonas deanei]
MILAKNAITQKVFPARMQVLLKEICEKNRFQSHLFAEASEVYSRKVTAHSMTTPFWIPYSFHDDVIPQSKEPPQFSSFLTKERNSVFAAVNAIFIEESDLFLFLTHHHLSPKHFEEVLHPSAQRAADVKSHFVFSKNAWSRVSCGSPAYAWLSSAFLPMEVQLAMGEALGDTLSRAGDRGQLGVTGKRDYMEYLMYPDPFAGAYRQNASTDIVWIDAYAVWEYRLNLHKDAFFIPIHANRTPSGYAKKSVKDALLSRLGGFYYNVDQLVGVL